MVNFCWNYVTDLEHPYELPVLEDAVVGRVPVLEGCNCGKAATVRIKLVVEGVPVYVSPALKKNDN